jgi:3-hydroxy acid dehydrogenase / malonic semialdehyde reductase
MEMTERIVLITGASAGIGEACARTFAAAGARLILAARREDRLQSVADALEKEFGREVCRLALDVRDSGVVAQVLENLPSDWAAIDVLINNAGLARGLDPLVRGEAREWDEMIDTNVKGLLYVTRAVLPGMVERGRGHVINISSTAGRDVYPGSAVYCSTKAAVDTISRGLRLDLVGTPVRVTNLEPGMVRTDFSEVRFRGDQDRAEAVYAGVDPLTAQDVADAVFFVATRPAHVNIDSLMMRPVAQASAALVARR